MNARSVRNKRNSVIKLICDNDPNCVIITEHWLSQEEADLFNIDNFRKVAFTARKNRRGGGVLILLRNDLNCATEVLPEISSISTDFVCEIAAVKLKFINWECIIMGVYRSPTNQTIESWNSFIDILFEAILIANPNESKVILAADFNVDLNPNSKNIHAHQLTKLLKNCNLPAIFQETTRLNLRSGKDSCIDNICTNLYNSLVDLKVISNEGLMDHELLFVSFNIGKVRNDTTVLKRRINDSSLTSLERALFNENWNNVLEENDVNKAYDAFYTIVLYYFNIYCPITKVSYNSASKQGIMWSEKVKRLREWICFFREARHSTAKNADILNFGKQILALSDSLKKAINEDVIRNNEKKIANSDNICKTTWSLINSVRTEQANSDPIALEIQGKLCNDEKLIAEEFNNYFLGVPDKIARELPNVSFDLVKIRRIGNSLFMKSTNEAEVLKVINSLSNKNSSGLDEMSNRTVKSIKNAILKPLCHIINLSMSTGTFPTSLKNAVIKPLRKSEKNYLPSNHRPIALLSPFSKVFEKIYLERVVGFLDKFSVLSQKQFGYRKGLSCIDAIISLNDLISQSKANNEICLTVFLDLSKAFDCVNHQTLLSITERYGVRGVALDLLNSYLQNRTQAVVIKNKLTKRSIYSQFKRIKEGVPQGSVYGPYLFLIYINCIQQILDDLQCDCILYVDDTTIILKGKSIQYLREKATLILNAIYNFFSSLNLALNLDKTNYMLFNYRDTDLNIYVNNVKIHPVISTKFLGIILASNRSWKPHINSVIKKLNKGIFILRQTTMTLGKKHNLLVFNAFIQSHLSYGITLWGSEEGNATILLDLFRKQKRAVRMINNIWDKRSSCRGLFKKDRILTLASIYIYSLAVYAKRHLTLETCESVHEYNTRNKKNLHTKVFKKGNVRGHYVSVYNKLPAHLKETQSVKSFKRKLKNYLIERECYNFQDLIE